MTRMTNRVEIDFSIYNPFDLDWIRDPFPTLERLRTEFPVAFHRELNAWLVSPHDLVAEVMRSPDYSTRSADWNNRPEPKPEAEWNLRDRLEAVSMMNLAEADHQRLRRLTAPAFSRRVMDTIEARIRDSVADTFDQIADPRQFDVATDLAQKIPVRAIARMVGVPAEAEELFEHGLAWNTVRATSPIYAADRDTYVQGLLPGLQLLFDIVAERRAATTQSDDFIGTLLTTQIDGEQLTDLDIVSVINAVVVAGADTAVDLHTYATLGFLRYPDQWRLLGERPDLADNAITEVLRWSAAGKFGAIPRYPLHDVELRGQHLEKGSFVMPLLSTAWSDPARWPEPERLDITRNSAGSIVFGIGPHLCIGLNFAKVQGRLMLEEWRRRFGDTARLVGEPEYDRMHFNARRITSLRVQTDPR